MLMRFHFFPRDEAHFFKVWSGILLYIELSGVYFFVQKGRINDDGGRYIRVIFFYFTEEGFRLPRKEIYMKII